MTLRLQRLLFLFAFACSTAPEAEEQDASTANDSGAVDEGFASRDGSTRDSGLTQDGATDAGRTDGGAALDGALPPRDVGADSRVHDAAAERETGACASGDGFAIASVAGALEDGASIEVCGAGFGATGPSILIHDDFEGGAAGSAISAEAALLGRWQRARGTYVDDDARSGSTSMLLVDANETDGRGVNGELGTPDDAGAFGFAEFDEFFFHASFRDLGDFPGNGSSPTMYSSDSSTKDIWVMYGGRGDNYAYSCSRGECNGNDLVLASHTGRGSFKHVGNETRTSWWLGSVWQFGRWNTMSTYLRIDRERPYAASHGRFENVTTAGYSVHDYDGSIFRPLDGLDPVWDRIKVGAWYRAAGNVRRIIDDLYVATGPGAAARVEMANAAAIDEATRLSLFTVTSWNDRQVSATVRLSDLADEEALYLFVVNAENERSPGFLVR